MKLKDCIPIATAGLSTPFEPTMTAQRIPINSDPPTTTPLILLSTLPYTTEAIPKAKKNIPTSSPKNTTRLLFAILPNDTELPDMMLVANKAKIPPRNWAAIYFEASLLEIFLIENKPSVTAGLIWQPDIWPIEYTKSIRVNAASTGVATGIEWMIDNATNSDNVNVPKNSAKYFFIN